MKLLPLLFLLFGIYDAHSVFADDGVTPRAPLAQIPIFLIPLCADDDFKPQSSSTAGFCLIPQGMPENERGGLLCTRQDRLCRLHTWQAWCYADGKAWRPRDKGECSIEDKP